MSFRLAEALGYCAPQALHATSLLKESGWTSLPPAMHPPWAQIRKDGSAEPGLVTVGDDLNSVAQFLAPGRESYSAADVVERLLSLSADVPQETDSLLAATA